MTDLKYVKASKGLLWMFCATQFSQGYCKYLIGPNVDLVAVDAFVLMMSGNFVCGYLIDLCTTNTYTQLTTEEWETSKLAAKPTDLGTNNFLDSLYVLSNPSLNPPTFRILWVSDINVDANYHLGASNKCVDYSCCHDDLAGNQGVSEND